MVKSASSSALVNINTGAVGLTATVIAAGIATAFIFKMISKDHQQVGLKSGHYPQYGRAGNYTKKNYKLVSFFPLCPSHE